MEYTASQPAAATKHRNELLVDAESFAYIFASPNGEHQQDPLAKVKTAMLLIQKGQRSTRLCTLHHAALSSVYPRVFPAQQRRCRRSQGHDGNSGQAIRRDRSASGQG